ncbi:MAG: ribosomal RNA small subunit methyltransferase A [Candidatus Vogelbacteria bacterium]|nr:ribosomal RNA small subunit methyltransferase A [Candidatus Vogelbacteria bacterium]
MINSAKPKKSLGQNFLTSVGAINKIVDTAVRAVISEIGSPGDPISDINNAVILEVGPGRGVLTEALLKKFERVIAVEKDDNLFEKLREKFANEIKIKQLILIHGDILKLSPKRLGLLDENYAIVANIPYYITGQFLRNWLSGEQIGEVEPRHIQPRFMVLMLQKEAAKRIVAQDKKESLLSISVKVYGQPKYIETVKRGSFYPIPKVDSAILLINNISKNFFKNPEIRSPENKEKIFFLLLHAGFAHKRKFLIKNLETDCPSKIKLQRVFMDCKISPSARAEDVRLEDWKCLSTKLSKN